jgi:hypothetical protein
MGENTGSETKLFLIFASAYRQNCRLYSLYFGVLFGSCSKSANFRVLRVSVSIEERKLL